MDLCTISSGKHGDDAIINSVKVAHLGNVVYVNLDDNRCKSKQFTIEVKARYNTVEVKVYKTGSNSRYGDLRDEGHVIAWKAEIRDDLDEEIAENIWNNRNKKNLLTYLGSLDRDLFEYGVEDRNHYFCSPQMLFGVVLSDCWHSFKEKFGEIAVQPELDLFGESSK
jgi:hypothetical protein